MALLWWIVLFAFVSAVAAWIVFGDSAENVVGLFFAGLLGMNVGRASESSLRYGMAATWVFAAIWFIAGLLDSAWRFI